jgi:hypothetical protein
MNWPVLIVVGIAAIILIMYLIIRNQKDKNELVDQLKNDYPKSKDEEGDVDIEGTEQMH